MENSSATRLIAAVAATLFFVGCGSQDWGYLDGTVKLNGQPVGPGTISLQPIDADRAGSMASFGEDGSYSVMSAGRKEGAHTGEYLVLIHGGENFGVEETGPKPKSAIPTRYGDPNTTDLKVKITPGSQTVDFDLKP
jgi:hypothetical protein